MKNHLYLLIVLLFFSCEDIVDIDLNTAAPRLVIDASINWIKNTTGNDQKIKLTLTAPFFNNNVPPANGATVSVTHINNGTEYFFIEDGDTGIYQNFNFAPEINAEYELNINYENQNYTARETLKAVVPIDYIEQVNDGGFTGEDIELYAYYTDPENEENYYLFEFMSNILVIPNLEVYDDEFTNGNQVFGYYSEEDLEVGDEIIIRNYGVSERFYEFMFILLQQGNDDSGPFETQPATVRGNCINITDTDNYPFGYFRLSEVDELVYTVQ